MFQGVFSKTKGLTDGKHARYAVLLLRLGLAIILIYHGWIKLNDTSIFVSQLEMISVPASQVIAWTAALVEFVGGIAVLIGFYTSLAALIITLEQIVALILIVGIQPYFINVELKIAVIAIAATLALYGGGMWSSNGRKKITEKPVNEESAI